MSTDARSTSKHAGDAVETAVVERVPEIEAVPDTEAEWCDARVVEAWLPPTSVPLLPDGSRLLDTVTVEGGAETEAGV